MKCCWIINGNYGILIWVSDSVDGTWYDRECMFRSCHLCSASVYIYSRFPFWWQQFLNPACRIYNWTLLQACNDFQLRWSIISETLDVDDISCGPSLNLFYSRWWTVLHLEIDSKGRLRTFHLYVTTFQQCLHMKYISLQLICKHGS